MSNPLANPMASMLGGPSPAAAKPPSKLPAGKTKSAASPPKSKVPASKVPASKVPVAKPATVSAGAADPAGGGNPLAAGGGNPLAAGGGNPLAAGGGNPLAAGAAPAKAPAKSLAKKVPAAAAKAPTPKPAAAPPPEDPSTSASAPAAGEGTVDNRTEGAVEAPAAGAPPEEELTADQKRAAALVVAAFQKKPSEQATGPDGKPKPLSKFRQLMKNVVLPMSRMAEGISGALGGGANNKTPAEGKGTAASPSAPAPAATATGKGGTAVGDDAEFARAKSETSTVAPSSSAAMSPNAADLPRLKQTADSDAASSRNGGGGTSEVADSEVAPTPPPVVGTVPAGGSTPQQQQQPISADAAAQIAQLENKNRQLDAQYNQKVRDLERRLVQAEGFVAELTRESKRLREQLYDRDGVKNVQHLATLEVDMERLKHALDKERDAVAYHRTAHMQGLEELARLKKTYDTHGDHNKLLSAKLQLQQQISELIRDKTECELRVSELEESLSCLERQEHHSLAKGKSVFVQCRRATLCDACQDMIEAMEARAAAQLALAHQRKGTGAPLVEDTVPPMLSQPWHSDPSVLLAPRDLRQSNLPQTSATSAAGFGAQPSHRGSRGWRVLRAPNGDVVYHNIVTNQSTLQRPVELYPDVLF